MNPLDARAHHVLAHVFEMTGRAAEGVRWMTAHRAIWSADSMAARTAGGDAVLDPLCRGARHRVRSRLLAMKGLADLIDASALLWRVQLEGGEIGQRACDLADAWAPHIDDRFCSFTDLHAMLAFVAARDWRRAKRLERLLAAAQKLPTRHAETTRRLGLPACRALLAFGRGDDALAVSLLATLPPWRAASAAATPSATCSISRCCGRWKRIRNTALAQTTRTLQDGKRRFQADKDSSGGAAGQ